MKKMRLSAVNFIRKNWTESFNNRIAYNRVGFKCICATFSRQNNQLSYKFLTRATECGKSMGSCNFGNILPIKVLKCYCVIEGKFKLFDENNFQSCLNFTIWNPVLTVPLGILLTPWTATIKKDTIRARVVSSWKRLEKRKEFRFTVQRKDLFSHSLVKLHLWWQLAMLARNLEWCWKEENFTNQNLITTLFTYTFSWCTRTRLGKKFLLTRRPIAALLFIISKLKVGDTISTAHYITYQTFSKLQFRQPVKFSFNSFQIDLRNTSGVKIPFAIVAITRFVLMYRKASNFQF